ncbi:MAG TPA: hypothetical protein VF780_01050 [Nitrosospira sp.]
MFKDNKTHRLELIPFVLIVVLLCFWLGQARAGALHKPRPLQLVNEDATIDIILEKGIIHFRTNNPNSSLEHKADRLRSLMSRFFLDHSKESQYLFTFGQYPELNSRMAGIASCSQQWDFKAGRVRSEDTATWLRMELNKGQVYHELVQVFDEFGYRIEISGLESIALCRPAEIDWTAVPRSCQTPIPPKAKLPCGGLITYRLTMK